MSISWIEKNNTNDVRLVQKIFQENKNMHFSETLGRKAENSASRKKTRNFLQIQPSNPKETCCIGKSQYDKKLVFSSNATRTIQNDPKDPLDVWLLSGAWCTSWLEEEEEEKIWVAASCFFPDDGEELTEATQESQEKGSLFRI